MNHLIKDKAEAIVATGERHFNSCEDIAFITIYFEHNIIAHINVNWLSPVKVRNTLIGGEKRMVVWNDLAADEKVKVYDKGVQITSREGVYDQLVSYRSGDMWAPKLDQTEALKAECEYFIACVRDNKQPFNDGHAGLEVVKMLEAADKSIRERGRIVHI
jgi:predicted dehydrogenase